MAYTSNTLVIKSRVSGAILFFRFQFVLLQIKEIILILPYSSSPFPPFSMRFFLTKATVGMNTALLR